MHSKRSLGFTLLELLIVLIILGIIASLAVPALNGQVERSKATEAIQRLVLTREAMHRYRLQSGSYAGATIPLLGGPGTIDYNPNDNPFGGSLLFTYTLLNANANNFSVRATRNSWAGCATIGRIDIDEDGVLTGTGAYANM